MRLRNIAATALFAASLAASAQAPKYIFYMIGDGMGFNTLDLYNLHYQGLMDARSAKIMESALTGWNQHGVDEQVLDQIRARQFKQMLLAYIN